MRGSKARSKDSVWFNMQIGLCQSLVVGPWLKKLYLDRLKDRVIKVGRRPLLVYLPVWLNLGRRGPACDDVPVLQSISSSQSSLSVVQVGTLCQFLDQFGSITFNTFVLNTDKGHHLQFRYHLPLFCNFKWF